MSLTVEPVRTQSDLDHFVVFPWSIYRNDPYWVPPLLDERLALLDVTRNPFWHNACRELWLARRDGKYVGTIAAIIDEGRIQALREPVGSFGFFECVPDQQVADRLVGAAAGWLREKGMRIMRGPYNPSGEGEVGILIEGFQTRPALLEAHHPVYYSGLIEACGMVKYRDLVARLWVCDPGQGLWEQMPGKLARAADLAAQRPDLRIRQINVRRWDQEIRLAWEIYTTCLMSLPEWVPFGLPDFQALAASFKAILDPRLALVAEIAGKPVGFVLALPDANEAFQKVLSHTSPRRPGPVEMLRLFIYTRRLTRATYKILMVLPEYQGRGIEAVLSAALARAVWKIGYREVDMSLTGEENEKSNRFQDNLGFKVYRRYRLYQKELG